MDSFHTSSEWTGFPLLSGALAASGLLDAKQLEQHAHAPASIEGPGCDQASGGHWRSVKERTQRPGRPAGGRKREAGAVGWGFLWLIGIPIPILVLLFVLRGCT